MLHVMDHSTNTDIIRQPPVSVSTVTPNTTHPVNSSRPGGGILHAIVFLFLFTIYLQLRFVICILYSK